MRGVKLFFCGGAKENARSGAQNVRATSAPLLLFFAGGGQALPKKLQSREGPLYLSLSL